MRAPESMWSVLTPRNKPKKTKKPRKPKTEQDKIAICKKRGQRGK